MKTDTSNQASLINVYRRKLNGYHPVHRNRWLLISNKILSLQSLVLFDFYCDVIDFDVKHSAFGQFEADFEAIAQLFSVSSSTVRNWHNPLLKKGFVRKTRKTGTYRLSNPLRYVSPGKWKGEAANCAINEKDQPIGKIFQSIVGKFQPIDIFLQSVEENIFNHPKKTDSIALGSSKVNLGLSNKGISREDRKWCESNVSEDK